MTWAQDNREAAAKALSHLTMASVYLARLWENGQILNQEENLQDMRARVERYLAGFTKVKGTMTLKEDRPYKDKVKL